MDEEGKTTDGEECEEPTAEPKPFNKDRLVLYHWTQSFASQKVKKRKKKPILAGKRWRLHATDIVLRLQLFVFACVRVCARCKNMMLQLQKSAAASASFPSYVVGTMLRILLII